MIITCVCLFVYLGPVVGLEMNGDSCVQKCQEFISKVFGGQTTEIYVSEAGEKASQDIDNFYNFVDMTMT